MGTIATSAAAVGTTATAAAATTTVGTTATAAAAATTTTTTTVGTTATAAAATAMGAACHPTWHTTSAISWWLQQSRPACCLAAALMWRRRRHRATAIHTVQYCPCDQKSSWLSPSLKKITSMNPVCTVYTAHSYYKATQANTTQIVAGRVPDQCSRRCHAGALYTWVRSRCHSLTACYPLG